ncbi:ThiF family adenylyltransferase [Paraburkholderia tropica]|uniref:ThiF family adenylyltransferase n=1 Tax=Paraburkholderia tropica TaxID=92647 RepID=UPI002AB243B6|nr:ThiF family adenylyltransferase [Paraburkholderia tropica]
MNADDTSGSRISRALAQRGFFYKGRTPEKWYFFEGTLRVDGIAYPVKLSVDPLCQQLPQIYLTPVPERLKPVSPHIIGGGFLCYAAAGSITLDVFDPDGQVLACLERAENVLGQILRGEPTADLEEEFFAYWPIEGYCLLDFDSKSARPLHAIVLKSPDSTHPFVAVTDDPATTSEKLEVIGATVDDKHTIAVRRVTTPAHPRPLQDQWPPRTVAELLRWQAVLDTRTRKKLQQVIHAEASTHANGVLCVVESPKFKYAFIVEYDRQAPGKRIHRSSLEIVYASKVVPLNCIRMDDEYVAQRNTPDRPTLAGRRIMLVGCGTIGGYLAECLTKAGAGTGGGELALVDCDVLFPQNVGRHRLGMNHVFHNKAIALAKEMKRSAPGADIRPFPADALQVNLLNSEFIIDATGEEALGHLLVQRLTGPNFRPSLTVWIEGPGIAVRGMLRDSDNAACVRCLKADDRTPIYPVVDGEVPVRLAGHGCESLYVPFPATVSMQAACLGAEMALDWASAAPTPRLRTRVLDDQYTKGHDDTNPERRPSCPACTS